MIRIGSICSGMGMALHGLGTTAWGIEYDSEIAAIYSKNHKGIIINDYVENVTPKTLEDVDCIIATPSCIRASVANPKGKESFEDKSVAEAIVNILKVKLPQFFILENVEGYKNFESFEIIRAYLTTLGYHVICQNLNLKDFGIAQSRKRMYLYAAKSPFTHVVPPLQYTGWYKAVKDIISSLPDTTLAKYQLNIPNTLVRRVGANKSNNRVYEKHEPCFTIRAFGRKADNHWHQADIIGTDYIKAVTPRACLRFFGDKRTADSIWLPNRNALAMEVVGNGASWKIMQILLNQMMIGN